MQIQLIKQPNLIIMNKDIIEIEMPLSDPTDLSKTEAEDTNSEYSLYRVIKAKMTLSNQKEDNRYKLVQKFFDLCFSYRSYL